VLNIAYSNGEAEDIIQVEEENKRSKKEGK
jgi:hypothetical protein